VTHMVIFRSPEGKPGYHQAEGLDEAMRFAEMLRNQEQVTDARIFRMDEVPIEFKAYYRVEVAGSGETAAANGEVGEAVTDSTWATADAEVTEPEAPLEAMADTTTATGEEGDPQSEEATPSGSGRYGLFSRG
jgi:hypothetical protein